MKFNSLNKLLAICLMFNITSCTKQPCKCDYNPQDFILVKFVNQQGQSLVSGPAAIYNTDSIRVLRHRDNFDTKGAWVTRVQTDSTEIHLLYPLPSVKTYVHYNIQTPQDSIELSWVEKVGSCCETAINYHNIESVKFNNQLIVPQNGVYYFVK